MNQGVWFIQTVLMTECSFLVFLSSDSKSFQIRLPFFRVVPGGSELILPFLNGHLFTGRNTYVSWGTNSVKYSKTPLSFLVCIISCSNCTGRSQSASQQPGRQTQRFLCSCCLWRKAAKCCQVSSTGSDSWECSGSHFIKQCSNISVIGRRGLFSS